MYKVFVNENVIILTNKIPFGSKINLFDIKKISLIDIVSNVKKHKKIWLLHFDAHADLRESYNGEKFSHASAIRRCLDYKNVSIISFGIRNISKGEIPFLKKNKSRINIFWAKDKVKWDLKKFQKEKLKQRNDLQKKSKKQRIALLLKN